MSQSIVILYRKNSLVVFLSLEQCAKLAHELRLADLERNGIKSFVTKLFDKIPFPSYSSDKLSDVLKSNSMSHTHSLLAC